MTQPFSLSSFGAKAYRDVLGKAGLRRYRDLAETEWGKVKPSDRKDHYDVSRARITRVMEQLAATGDGARRRRAAMSRNWWRSRSAFTAASCHSLWKQP